MVDIKSNLLVDKWILSLDTTGIPNINFLGIKVPKILTLLTFLRILLLLCSILLMS